MPWSTELAHHLVRALHLLALSVAPRALSPEPALREPILASALGAGLALTALVVLATKLPSWVETPAARAAAALWWLVVAAALFGAVRYTGERAPLMHGVVLVAPVLWGALAATAAALAGRFIGSSIKHKRMAAAVLVLAAGAKLMLDAAPVLGSTDRMWAEVLRRDFDDERALGHVAAPLLAAGKLDRLDAIAGLCLGSRPQSCACQELRAEVALRRDDLARARELGQTVVALCPERGSARALLARALVPGGDGSGAKREASPKEASPKVDLP